MTAMITAMRVSELELMIRNMLGDNTNYTPEVVGEIAGNTWSASMLLDSINFACKRYCLKTNATYTVASITPTQGAFPGSVYNELVLPTDYLDVVRVMVPSQAISVTPYTVAGAGLLVETTKKMESLRNPFWEQQTGTLVKKWFEKDGRTIGITPNVSTTGFSGTSFKVGYIQAPTKVTSLVTVSVANLEVGTWYEIATVGTTDFTNVGAANSIVGTKFQATAKNATSGTVYELIDARIPPAHQEYLRFLASAYLVSMSNDQQSLDLAKMYYDTFDLVMSGGV